MTQPLSPAAQAVLDAFLVVDDARHAIAAALRAAVDQTFPDERDIETELIRSDLLAIAEALARWGRQPAPHDDRGVLPMVISDTGASDEPERERIICASISGGADYINNMPRMLILGRITSEGSTYQQYIQEPTPPAEGEVAELAAWLHDCADVRMDEGYEEPAFKFTRAAELLQQQHPTPVPVSERGIARVLRHVSDTESDLESFGAIPARTLEKLADTLEAPTLFDRAMAGDASAARRFLHEAGYTDASGNWLPKFQPQEDSTND